MEIIKISMLGIAVALLAVELKAYKPALSVVLGLAGALFIFIFSLDKVFAVIGQINQVFDYLGESASHFSILLKVLGVTYLCQFSSGVCKDAGLTNLAEQVQIFGKLYIMIAGMPILLAFVEVIQNL